MYDKIFETVKGLCKMKFSELTPGDVFGHEGTIYLRYVNIQATDELQTNVVCIGTGQHHYFEDCEVQVFPHGHYESEDTNIAEFILPLTGTKIIVDADRLDELNTANIQDRVHCWKLNTHLKTVYKNEGVDHRGAPCYRDLANYIMRVPNGHVIKFRNNNKLDYRQANLEVIGINYHGVCDQARSEKNPYRAYHPQQRVHLGVYDTREKAAKAYDLYVVMENLSSPLNFPENLDVYQNPRHGEYIEILQKLEKILKL